MKKGNFVFPKILFGLVLAAGGFSLASAQSVSTQVQKKNVLLEEYTGVGCGNCPDGARVAATIKEAAGDRFYVVAIHEGAYAEPWGDIPDYRTDWGAALLAQAGDIGYPQGSLNRLPYESGLMNSNRGTWTKRVKALLQEDAPVNLHLDAALDATTREMCIRVELCYTQAVEEDFHLLNIALVQNHILGYQNGANMGYDYSHEHMLRDLITGQWGDTVQVSAAGEVRTLEYTYIVPDSVGSVPVDVRNIELVAFMTRTTADVLNVTGAKPRIDNLDEPVAVSFSAEELPSARYAGNVFPAAVRNLCNDTLRSLSFSVDVNGEVRSSRMEVAIPPYQDANLEIPVEAYPVLGNNTVVVALETVNGESVSVPSIEYSFTGPMPVSSLTLYVDWKTDNCPDEASFKVKDRNGNVFFSKGPFEGDAPVECSDTVILPAEGIYELEFSDQWLDGWQEGSKGTLKVKASDGKLVGQNYSVQGAGETLFVSATDEVGNEVPAVEAALRVLPAEDGVRILNPAALAVERVQVYDLRSVCLYDKAVDTFDDLFVPLAVQGTQVVVVRCFWENGVETAKVLLP